MTDVLDHGVVLLVDAMASDGKVVRSARVSTGRGGPYELTDLEVSNDVRLIDYLMRNGHGTPFEHAVFQFYIKCPIFVAREWQRHRMASYNEFSMRYAEVGEDQDFYIPDHVRVKDSKNKQSSVVSDDVPMRTAFILGVEHHSKQSLGLYRAMLEGGVAREMARMVVSVNIYTEFWFTVNARSLMNFLMLRNAPGAQWEIQQYAKALEEMFKEHMPWTHEAFVANGRKAP